MKTRKQTRKTLSFKVQIYDGTITVELRLPANWFIPFITIVSALLSPSPIMKLLAVLISMAE